MYSRSGFREYERTFAIFVLGEPSMLGSVQLIDILSAYPKSAHNEGISLTPYN